MTQKRPSEQDVLSVAALFQFHASKLAVLSEIDSWHVDLSQVDVDLALSMDSAY